VHGFPVINGRQLIGSGLVWFWRATLQPART
jgi:hypothetical protein